MFEVLRLLIETLTQGLPNFNSFREEKKRRELASNLFVIYIRFNEAMLAGDRIVSLLESLTESEDSWERHFLKEQLRDAVKQQEITLGKLVHLLTLRRNEMWILEPDAYRKINYLVSSKSAHLLSLGVALAHGNLPLDADSGRLEEDVRTERRVPSFPNPLSVRIVVDTNGSDRRSIRDVREYIRSGVPQSRIADIRSALESMRAALEAHFSLSDVLLDVGDRRFR
ncbi:hypothetical protein [Streptomyces sp. NPDC091217]|uniref:hypothetical protein n=1 Tax=Streptomyces sp. NPDC091217 TaxID=3365975 RepID=UPI0038215202